jgi:hypothetical protein
MSAPVRNSSQARVSDWLLPTAMPYILSTVPAPPPVSTVRRPGFLGGEVQGECRWSLVVAVVTAHGTDGTHP